jgi:hypothetical protein
MKFNWGTGIALALTLFVGGMMWTFFNTYEHQQELVVDEYYNKENVAIERANQRAEARAIQAQLTYRRTTEALILILPDTLAGKGHSGTLEAYYPTAAAQDFTRDWPAEADSLVLPLKDLGKGRCQLRLTLGANGTGYLIETDLLL